MGLIDYYKHEWKWNSEEERYNSRIIWNGLSASNSFLNGLSFTKCNIPFNCKICGKTKPKSTRYVGDNFRKICCDCTSEWVDNSIKTLQEMEMLLKKSKQNLKLNKDKWRKEMLIGALS